MFVIDLHVSQRPLPGPRDRLGGARSNVLVQMRFADRDLADNIEARGQPVHVVVDHVAGFISDLDDHVPADRVRHRPPCRKRITALAGINTR